MHGVGVFVSILISSSSSRLWTRMHRRPLLPRYLIVDSIQSQ